MRVSNTKEDNLDQPYGRAGLWNGLVAVSLLGLAVLTGLSLLNTTADSEEALSSIQEEAIPKRYPVTIRKPAGPPRIDTGLTNPHGEAVTVACSTCHTTREPDFTNKTVADLKEYHGNLKLSHGSVSCLSCHNSTDYDALKLADGSRVEFTEVMRLCAQCHGPQMKDYEHGAHGGMNGYWDLTRGPQKKNNCIDCHSPHAPQFPKMQPTFKPKDRFLNPTTHHGLGHNDVKTNDSNPAAQEEAE